MSNWTHKKKKKKSTGSDIDFDYIADQVETGLKEVTNCAVIDFGLQDGGYFFDEKGFTYFQTEEEVHTFLDFISDEPTLGDRLIENHELDEFEEVDEIYKLPFKIVNKKWVFTEDDDESNISYMPTQKKAEKALAQAIDLLEKQAKTGKGYAKKMANKKIDALEDFEIEAMEDVFEVPCAIRKADDEYEVGIWVEVPDNRVEYVEGDEDSIRQYRLPLNPSFKGHVSGFRLTQDRKTDVFNGRAITDLIKACGLEDDVLDKDSDDMNNLSLLAGASFQTTIEEKNGFFKVKGRLPVADDADIEPLDNEAIAITFEDDPEDIAKALRGFYLQQAYKDKIKAAVNYKGSNMEKAFELLEEGRKGGKEDTPAAPEESSEEGSEESSAKAKGRAKRTKKASEESPEPPKETKSKAKKKAAEPEPKEEEKEEPKKKAGRPKKAAKKVEPEPETGDEWDEDIPF